MKTQSSKKRTLVSFSLALATALMTLYIQDYTASENAKPQFEANATNHDVVNFIETID